MTRGRRGERGAWGAGRDSLCAANCYVYAAKACLSSPREPSAGNCRQDIFTPVVSSNARGGLAPRHVTAVPQHPCVDRRSCPSLRRGTRIRQDKCFAQGCPLDSDRGCLQHQMELLCPSHPQWGHDGALHGESGDLDPSLATFSRSLPLLPLRSHPQGAVPSGNLPRYRVPPLGGRGATETTLDPTHCD